ncbi:MAG: hypothetical protein J1E63_10520, partial [Muribaculaceae bacterium]|nr:hypothetical protein [Muribaculaceae bacterium]
DATFIDAVAARLGSLDGCIAKIKDANGDQTFNPGVAAVNGTTTTNLGLFRAYLCQYLIDNKMISDKDQILVRTLAPTPEGLPLNIYCYVASTEWTTYEAVQSALFEQIAILAPIFDLRVYNSTSDNTLFNVESGPSAPSSPSR